MIDVYLANIKPLYRRSPHCEVEIIDQRSGATVLTDVAEERDAEPRAVLMRDWLHARLGGEQ